MKKALKKNRVRIRNSLLGLVVVGLLLVSFLIIYGYATNAGADFLPKDRGELGQFGDYFGGTLNPIFGFASFIALLITIFYQAKELKLSTDELRNSAKALSAQNKAIELQSFEQTFFSWLNTYRSILTSLEDETNYQDSTLSGRRQLNAWWQSTVGTRSLLDAIADSKEGDSIWLSESIVKKAIVVRFEAKRMRQFLLDTSIEMQQDMPRLILSKWKTLYKSKEFQLDSLFRILYKLLVWIDSQDESRLTNAQKWLYITIIRSQLSWIEMAFLYLNGLTEAGKKFKPIAEKYALFDNLTFDSDVSIEILKIYLLEPIAYLPEAYNSEVAREKIGLPKSSEETLALATTAPSNS